jgi:acetyl esterase
LREAGVAVEAETFSGLLHGFVRATEFIAQSRTAMSKAVAFMQRVV